MRRLDPFLWIASLVGACVASIGAPAPARADAPAARAPQPHAYAVLVGSNAGVGSAAACGAGPDGSPTASGDSRASGAAASNANARPDEATRVQAYLDSLYLRSSSRGRWAARPWELSRSRSAGRW
jgi:hypothetical protein